MTRLALVVGLVGLVIALGGCSQCGRGSRGGSEQADDGSGQPAETGDTTPEQPQGGDGKSLLVAESTFSRNEKGRWVQPDAAKLIILRQKGSSWQREEIVDRESNVFHKGIVQEGEESAIITIGAEKALLKRWTRSDNDWSSTTLWETTFGGRFDRFRDMEIADVNGDGRDDIALATHDQGVVAVLLGTESGWSEPMELDRIADTFVHEVEIGDIDGDGTPEIYTTPSQPNRGSGGSQPGKVKRYRWTGEAFEGELVAEWAHRHAKEIMVTDIDGNGRAELYVALEGQTEKAPGNPMGRLVNPVEIVKLTPQEQGWDSETIGTIADERLCRFLVAGDMDGDGANELIAASFSHGIWMFEPGDSLPWSSTQITSATGGFEHATLIADIDGDEVQELYVADDTHGRLVRFTWNNGSLSEPEVLLTRTVPQSAITWNLWVGQL